jgi:hypothetical protein
MMFRLVNDRSAEETASELTGETRNRTLTSFSSLRGHIETTGIWRLMKASA